MAYSKKSPKSSLPSPVVLASVAVIAIIAALTLLYILSPSTQASGTNLSACVIKKSYKTVSFSTQAPFQVGVFTGPQFVSSEGIPFRGNSGGPVLAASGLKAGDILATTAGGAITPGKGWPTITPAQGKDYWSAYGYLILSVVGQFTDNNNKVIGDGFYLGAAMVKTVPAGATKLYVAFTDEWYGDNSGSMNLTAKSYDCTPATPTPTPTPKPTPTPTPKPTPTATPTPKPTPTPTPKPTVTPTPVPAAKADLIFTMTGPSSAVPGGTIHYKQTVFNAGPAKALNIRTTGTKPPKSAIAPGLTSDSCYENASGKLVCDFQDITTGSKTRNLGIRLPADTACGSTVFFSATVVSDTSDPINTNNAQRVETRIECADTPAPTPTVAPTATPTPMPITEATPAPEQGHPNLRISKTDSRDITRPGHSVVYTVEVENTGSADIHDLVITDTYPTALEITGISHGGTRQGNTITWAGLQLGAGETIQVSFVGMVKLDTPNGYVLFNSATARSSDHGIVVTSAADSTKVEVKGEVAGAATQPVTGTQVPITAKTGAATTALALLSTLLGTGGLTFLIRRGF